MPACAIEIICETHIEGLPLDLENWLTPKLLPMMEYLKCSHCVELVLVSSEQIAKLNLEFRNINKSTDVLSFPIEMPAQQLLGSVVINVNLAIQESQARGHTLLDEIALLFVHGYLHLLGYDHECDQGQQRALEQEIIAHFNLPLSLMARTEYL
ncbi:rRNA maturation RNase YbeY [Helicobacter bizzozeronii]|uniref:rRNA maturation RNase YbeY n=1 Tax=Helicobacter bizzozeronii TaxID=56877 RepID=UPI000CEF1D81|nr:rRNA maturation RNase YbeY [Helicobacter bizzozeronii]